MPLDVGGAEIASLGLRLDASSMVSGSRDANTALNTLASTAERTEAKVVSLSARTRASGDALGSSTAQTRNLTASLTDVGGASNIAGAGIGGLASNLARSGAETETHALKTGRMIRAFEGLTASATGANREILTITALLGEFAAGNLPILAVGAAIGAASLAYEVLTEKQREQAKAQDEATAALEKWYATQKNGAVGDLIPQIDAENKKIKELHDTLDQPFGTKGGLKGLSEALLSGLLSGEGQSGLTTALAEFFGGIVHGIDEGGKSVAAAMAEAGKRARDAKAQYQTDLAGSLSSLVLGGETTGARSAATDQLAIDRSLLARAQGQLASISQENDPAGYAAAAKNVITYSDAIKTLTDALTHLTLAQQAVLDANAALIKENEDQRAATQSLTDSLSAQYEAMRKIAGLATPAAPADPFHITGGPLGDLTTLQKDITADRNALNDFTRQGLQEYNDGLTKSSELTKQAAADAAHLGDVIGRDLAKAVVDFAARGSFSFGSFFKDATNLSLRLVGELDSGIGQLQGRLADALKIGGQAGADAAAQIRKEIAGISGDLTAAKYVSAGVAGASLGFSSANPGVGAVAGAAQGAQFGPAGALVGAFAGVIGGFLGAAEAHREAAKALQAAGDKLDASLTSFNTTGNPVSQALAQNAQTLKQLQDQAKSDFQEAVKNNNGSAAGRAVDQYQQAGAEAAANARKIADDFWDSMTQKINSLKGPAGEYANAVNALNKEEVAALFSAHALGESTQQVTQIADYYNDALNRLTASYQEGLKQTQYALDAREAAAKGDSAVAEAFARRAAEEKELFDDQQAGYTAAQLAQVAYIQGLEDEAAATKKLTDAQESLASNLAAGPGGTLSQQQAAARQPSLDQYGADLENYNAAVAAGLDPITQLGLQTQVAADEAALAARAFQDAAAAMEQTASDIEDAVSGGYLSGSAGLSQERQTFFGDSTISDAAIKALYSIPENGQELTDQQRETNKLIDKYFADEAQWGPAIAGAASSIADAASSPGGLTGDANTQAIARGAGAIADVTANRMADYLASLLIVAKEIRDDNRAHFGGGAPSFAPSSPSGGASSNRTLVGALAGAGGALTVNVNVNLTGVNTADTKALARRLGPAIAQEINDVLAGEYIDAQRRRGETTISGV